MGFFDLEHPPPPPAEEPEQPEWIGPPDGVVGGVVATQLLLHSSPELFVAATHIAVYPNGLTFDIQAAWQGGDHGHEMHSFGFHDESSDDAFFVGVLFPDGRRARSSAPFPDEDPSPLHPVLVPQGGGGGASSWRQGYWVWPELPPGDLDFVIEWRARSIDETHVTLAGEEIAEARERIVQLWPQRGA